MQRNSKATGERVVPLVRDDAVAELLTDEQQSKIVERCTAEAVGFIRTNKDKPFFLYLPHTAVHTRIHPGEKFRGKSANGRFGDWVEEVDWSVGQVFDTLRELKLTERTLVIFTSDNGPWLVKGADGGSAKPLRAGKGSTWEGGVRVPTIAWWPGRIAPRSASDAVAGTIDLLPTFVAVAGGRLPAEPVIDGRDLPLYSSATARTRRARRTTSSPDNGVWNGGASPRPLASPHWQSSRMRARFRLVRQRSRTAIRSLRHSPPGSRRNWR